MLEFDRLLDLLILILVISMAISFIRLYLGPDVPNRTVAFDSIAVHTVSIVALFAIRNGTPSLLDVAIVTAVLGFLGTTMLARYLERQFTLYRDLLRPPQAEARKDGQVTSE
ncbi:MAG: cation transporter [Chloroflexi bacterium]|nr:MAG: cation transporter [Chloroflexota bacterium]